MNQVLVKENGDLESQKVEELEELRRMAEERELVRLVSCPGPRKRLSISCFLLPFLVLALPLGSDAAFVFRRPLRC